MEKKLEVKDLIISFRTQNGKVQAVRDISFDLYKGETLAIVGESGSGKSVTSRAVMGILAGNSIVEGGEIIYDGQDLLKISEEDFQKLRGDKIGMIFQDPLSSLNPIVKVGKQLTEAMLLKSSAGRRNARNDFNGKLAELNRCMDVIADGEAEIAANRADCKTFDNFCINSLKLESAYNELHKNAEELKLDIENTLFLVSKNQSIDVNKTINHVLAKLPTTVHVDIVVMDELGPSEAAAQGFQAAVLAAWLVSRGLQRRGSLSAPLWQVLGILVQLGAAAVFAVWTVNPPELPLFVDPTNGTRGV